MGATEKLIEVFAASIIKEKHLKTAIIAIIGILIMMAYWFFVIFLYNPPLYLHTNIFALLTVLFAISLSSMLPIVVANSFDNLTEEAKENGLLNAVIYGIILSILVMNGVIFFVEAVDRGCYKTNLIQHSKKENFHLVLKWYFSLSLGFFVKAFVDLIIYRRKEAQASADNNNNEGN